MDNTYLRLLAHVAAIGLVTACIIALIIAWRERHSIRIGHVPLAISSLALFGIWFMFLALSIRNIAILPREQIALWLGVVELGAVVLGWSWFVLTARNNFRFTLHVDVEPTPTI